MSFFTKTAAAGLALVFVTACSQQEEPIVMEAQTPIYAKDGTIIGMRPTVTPGGMDDDPVVGDTSEEMENDPNDPSLFIDADGDGEED